VIEALGIEDLLASEIASKREAQKLGLVASDLNIRQSRYRCEACLEANDNETSQGVCPVCQGARYARIVSDMSVGRVPIREIMTGACSRLVEVAWRSDELAVISEVLGDPCFDQIALGDSLSKFSPLDRSFIAMFGGLLRIRARCLAASKRGREGDKPELVLIDGPYMLYQDHFEPLKSILKRICDDGHAIVYAGMPKALEFSEAAVIRLESRIRPKEERVSGLSLRQRYGRCITVL
jgi:excinuclease UvrABC ATPase subunit